MVLILFTAMNRKVSRLLFQPIIMWREKQIQLVLRGIIADYAIGSDGLLEERVASPKKSIITSKHLI